MQRVIIADFATSLACLDWHAKSSKKSLSSINDQILATTPTTAPPALGTSLGNEFDNAVYNKNNKKTVSQYETNSIDINVTRLFKGFYQIGKDTGGGAVRACIFEPLDFNCDSLVKQRKSMCIKNNQIGNIMRKVSVF